MLEVVYSDLKNESVSKDPEDVPCTLALWRKVVQGAPASYSGSLLALYYLQMDTPAVEVASSWLQNVEETLGTCSSLQASTPAFRGSPRDHSSATPIRRNGSPKNTPWNTLCKELWFFPPGGGQEGVGW